MSRKNKGGEATLHPLFLLSACQNDLLFAWLIPYISLHIEENKA